MLPLLAWMATMFIGQRTNSAALAAITTHLKKLGNRAYRMSPTELVEQLEPVVARVADDRTCGCPRTPAYGSAAAMPRSWPPRSASTSAR